MGTTTAPSWSSPGRRYEQILVKRPGAITQRLLPDGRELVVYPLLTGTARLVVGLPTDFGYDDSW